jgi:hypothetical protein
MPGQSGISGLALAEIAAGFILAWSGIENVAIATVIKDFVSGTMPPAGPPVTYATPASSGETGPDTGANAVPSGPKVGTVTPAQAYSALINAGLSSSAALILTAIGGAESNWNAQALNNDPATGDYSVGVWQINYYGSLMAERSALFGPPQELLGNLQAQADAAAAIYKQAGGFSPWTTYTRGTYQQYLGQAMQASGG